MKVKAVKRYFDKELSKYMEAGEEFEVKKERADVLCRANVVTVKEHGKEEPKIDK